MTNPRPQKRQSPLRQPPVSGRVKLDQLADILGLSKSTVSRALNGYSDISDTTRKRVEATARKMGYRPLSHAQAIRTGRVRAIAMVINSWEPDRNNPFLQDFLAGACEAASASDWTMTISTAKSEKDMLDVLGRLVEERKADGFILPRTEVDDARIHYLRELKVPFILYGRTGYGETDPQDDISWFDISGEAATHNAVTRLAHFGHHRIAYIGSDPKFNYSRLRRDGYLQGLQAAGLTMDPDLVRDGARTREEGAAEAQALMQLPNPPTAIVCATDLAALGCYPVCAELGLEIGHDVSIVGYDGIPECQYVNPGLTTFSVDSRRAGERLATLLIRQTRGEEPATLRELSDAVLIARESDGPPRLTPEALTRKINQSNDHNRGGNRL
ncbi:substrate-binding domain-containing protein [Ruegeria sp. R14_0]|nr:substrate-binding domain-containing protein [Ruegeria sp. R14_0]